MKKNYFVFLLLVFSSLFSVYGQTCDAPTNLNASNLNGTTATISWLYSGPATTWEIFIQPVGSPAPTTQVPSFVTNANPYMITGLTPCTAYDVYVRTVCDAATRSNWSGPLSFGSNATITASAVLTQSPTCTSPGTVVVSAAGGSGNYDYAIASQAGEATPYQSSNVFNIVAGGSYTFMVRDRTLGCIVTTNVMVTQPNPLSVSAIVSGNTITAQATGGSAPYEFSVNGGAFSSLNIFTNLTPGTYTIRVRDANGCFADSATVTITSSLSVHIVETTDVPVSSLYASVSGGTPPYTFQWSLNGTIIQVGTQQSLSVMGQFGQYTVTVTDSVNATVTASTYVEGIPITAGNDAITVYPGSSSVNTSVTSVLANDFLSGLPVYPNRTGLVTLTPLTIPSGFTINTDGTISVLPGTAAGTYTLTYKICAVSSPTSCSSTATATVVVATEGFLLKAFLDSNTNGIQDSGEVNFALGSFQYEMNSNGNVNTIVSSDGIYYIQESNPSNSYNFSYAVNSNYSMYYGVTPSSYSNVTYVAGSGLITYNFPVTQLAYADASVVVIPYGTPPRPGFSYTNRIYYSNNGNSAIASGTLTFIKPGQVSISAVSQAGVVSNANGFTYNFTNLQPYETRTVDVTMLVPAIPTVSLNDLLTCNALLSNLSSDVNAANNSHSLTQIIVGSYDPNDKTESHGGKIVHSTFGSNDYLTYTIQFENTGTYYAENVRINDVLDAKLDEASVKMVNATHPFLLTQNDNVLNWNFNGIDLLPAGKGQVTFQVKPKPGYAIGDIIPNTASIYFDFNPAIVTNTFETEFVNAMSTDEFTKGTFSLYPNPANGIVNISLKGSNVVIDSAEVMDISGKVLFKKIVNNPNAVVDLTSLANGMYFIKLKANHQEQTLKIIKE